MRGRTAKLLVSAAVAANLLPAALLIWFVRRFGVDLPAWDEWDCFVLALQRADHGTLGFVALLSQHNEHRPVFPRLLTLANAALFHWDRTVEMYVTVALLIFCVWLLYRFAWAYWGHPLTPLLFLPVAWALFSWRQSENLLMGMGTVFSLFETGTVLAFLLLHRAGRTGWFVWAAASAAFVASFSSGGGLLIWPIGLAQLLLQRWCGGPEQRPGRGALMVWTGAGVLTWALFFFGYQQPPVAWPTGLVYMIQHPGIAVSYVATMMGSPLFDRNPVAESLGVMVTALGAWAVFRLRRVPRDMAAAAPLLALLALVVVTSAAACDRRMGLGLGQAFASRYCPLTTLGLVALYALLTRFALQERRAAMWLAPGVMAALLLAGAMTSFHAWRRDPPGRRAMLEMATYAARYADVMSDEAVSPLHPVPDIVRELAPFLRAHGYSLFHQAVPMGVPARYDGGVEGCAIEAVNGRTGETIEISRRSDASGLRVTGWAVAGREPGRLFVSVDGRLDVPALPASHGTTRFISYVRTSLLAVGEHTLQLKIVNRDGDGYRTCGSAHVRVAE